MTHPPPQSSTSSSSSSSLRVYPCCSCFTPPSFFLLPPQDPYPDFLPLLQLLHSDTPSASLCVPVSAHVYMFMCRLEPDNRDVSSKQRGGLMRPFKRATNAVSSEISFRCGSASSDNSTVPLQMSYTVKLNITTQKTNCVFLLSVSE